MQEHFLSLLIFLPLAGALLMLFWPSQDPLHFRRYAIGVAALQFILVTWVSLFSQFSEEKATWFVVAGANQEYFSAGYHVALDGLSFPLFWLTSLVVLIALVASGKIKTQVKGYYSLMLVLHTAVSGTFAAVDFLLFYVFFEFMLIPMYFLIGIWGSERREYAALKFFIYTLAGSLFILVAMILLYISVRQPGTDDGMLVHTFDLEWLTGLQGLIPGSILDPSSNIVFWGLPATSWVFLLLLTGFAIKVPIVPFHTWLPDAHVESPTPVSVILAALLLKTGTYGIIRFACLILPNAFIEFTSLLSFFAVLSILYGAMNALASKDLKKMIAYSSISHMGFVILGIAATTSMAMQGAIFQMVSHGLISAMLFLLVGSLQERTNDRTIANYSGLFSKMPLYSSMVLIGFFAGMGIPGFSSFIGEVLVLLGSFNSSPIPGWLPMTATVGILLSAGYFSWTIQRMFFGPFQSKIEGQFHDLTNLERLQFLFLSILIILLGIYPAPLLDVISEFSENWPKHFMGSAFN
ncbi:MAG: complex I subunit 4 family protein [Cyclobacteriaceae bacterium]|jgi:NADH-quinone oxidoreductase subunit M